MARDYKGTWMSPLPLLIVGSGPDWQDEVNRARYEGVKFDVMVVNNAGFSFHDRIMHWVTMHPEDMKVNPVFAKKGLRLLERRKAIGGNLDFIIHAPQATDGVDCPWVKYTWGGSSGLFAVYVGLQLNYKKIILAGVPLSSFYELYLPRWKEHFEDMKDRVRSFSGLTRELLGAPDENWLKGTT